MSMLIGRLEESSILLLSGDLKQNNNPQKFRNNGLEKIIKKLVEKQRKEFGCIKLQKTERSEVAKLAEDLL
ncbi:MAG: PhoH family protein [Candidatus Peribacteria bacterium]|jgi:predicted ribonuclease YlaK|nr:PhoH family protein [Candidatus Peribacteria bacterium]